MGKITVVLGAQWGDEGKGKLVDILGGTHSVIVRSGGGANAGHTIVRDGKKYIFSLLPSAMIDEKNIGVIGNGCVVNLPSLKKEIENLEKTGVDLTGRILISSEAHLLFDFHKAIDEFQENAKGVNLIGTTKRGIGPCYADKVSRVGIRAGDFKAGLENFNKKFDEACDRIKFLYNIEVDREAEKEIYAKLHADLAEYILDTSLYIEKAEAEGKNILLEGAQAFMLDIDHGTYPFVTSSSINTGGMGAGCGMSPRKFTEVIGVTKAYCTRVGSGPFPSELSGEQEEFLRKEGGEFGAVTGRPRRCGWIDTVALKKFVRVNGPDNWNITKLDVLSAFDKIGVVVGYKLNNEIIETCPSRADEISQLEPIIEYKDGWKTDISNVRSYEELPENAKKLLGFIEQETNVPVKYIGVGAGSEALIIRENV